jgi:uncharacterized protein (TIGR02391 family)
VPNVATIVLGGRYLVTRREPGGEARHKVWALEVSDAGGKFDLKADIRPGDVVTVKQPSGHCADRVIETASASLDGRYTRVTWRAPRGAPLALSLTDLHPVVQEAAWQLYLDGHYGVAVAAAAKALEIAVRERSGLPASPNLMGSAFSDHGPLDVRYHDGVTGDDEQAGFRFLFMGAATALRNPHAHEFIDDDALPALEQLALISLLMRRLDSSRKKRRRKTPPQARNSSHA